ncbi:MAG: phosphoribosylglycinamide formyltransferase [Firmicutes bacterium]|nr:phosphoribosylglycinamide formyltransferase [Bacillota bacterium]
MNIAILVSGSGSNMMAIIDACKSGLIAGEIVAVISSNHEAKAVERAKQMNISTFVCAKSDFLSPNERDEHMLKILKEKKPDLIVLAGYLGILNEQIIESYNGKIINVHPSLLPKFGGHGFFGMNVHKAVIESGEKESGATVHFVDNGIDTGKILSQEKVKIEPNDTPETLSEKVLKIEHKILVETIKKLTRAFSPFEGNCYYLNFSDKGIEDA